MMYVKTIPMPWGQNRIELRSGDPVPGTEPPRNGRARSAAGDITTLEISMANITRFDPFGDIATFAPFRDIEELLRVPRLRSWGRDFPAAPEIKIDVTEDEKTYHVKAEVPGVKKEDIHVAVEGNQVSISAEVRKEEEEKKGKTVLRSERYYGKQERSFTLMHDLDEGKAEAKYQDGILDLVLPKKNGAVSKQLAIK